MDIQKQIEVFAQNGTSGQLILILLMNNINSRWLIWIWMDKWNYWFHILAARDFFSYTSFTMLIRMEKLKRTGYDLIRI